MIGSKNSNIFRGTMFQIKEYANDMNEQIMGMYNDILKQYPDGPEKDTKTFSWPGAPSEPAPTVDWLFSSDKQREQYKQEEILYQKKYEEYMAKLSPEEREEYQQQEEEFELKQQDDFISELIAELVEQKYITKKHITHMCMRAILSLTTS